MQQFFSTNRIFDFVYQDKIILKALYNRFAAQISRLLVMDPAVRLTAEQALAHPFFRLYQREDVRLFSPRKTFRVSHSIDLAFY